MKLVLLVMSIACIVIALSGKKSDEDVFLIVCNIFWVGAAIIDAIESRDAREASSKLKEEKIHGKK